MEKNTLKAIVTIPPYAEFIDEVLAHEACSGIRLNTVMPVKESLDDLLKRLKTKADEAGKQLFIDLKYRQLRVKSYGVPPFTDIELSHKINVDTPTTAYFSNGEEAAKVVAVDGNRLIMEGGPRRVVGPGESVNIPDPSLKIEGTFTDKDRAYVEAGAKVGIKDYMLSFVEGKEDIDGLKKLYPDANVVAKIESRKGLAYVKKDWKGEARLMAARGDLFVEVKMPHEILKSVESIVTKDKDAIVASRIFPSLAYSMQPSCQDIGDFDSLARMGYRTFMFGDEICQKRDSIISGLNLFAAIAAMYK